MIHALVVVLLAVPCPLQDADDTDRAAAEAVAKFKADYFSPRAGDKGRAAAVRQVALMKHPSTLRACVVALRDVVDAVRVEAVRQIGTFKDVEGAANFLLLALDDRSNVKKMAVRREIVRSLTRLEAKEALPVIHRLLSSREFEVAKEAVLFCGKMPHKASLPLLIRELKKAERKPENVVNPAKPTEGIEGYGLPSKMQAASSGQRKEQQRRRQILLNPLLATLRKITKEKFTEGWQWERWWRIFGPGFRVETGKADGRKK